MQSKRLSFTQLHAPLLAFVLSCPAVACTASEDDSEAMSVVQGDSGTPAAQPTSSASEPSGPLATATPTAEMEDDEGPLFGGGGAEITIDDGNAVPDAGAGDGPVAQFCPDAVGMGSEPLIDDFEDEGDGTLEIDGRGGSWYHYNADQDFDVHIFEYASPGPLPSGGDRALHTAGSDFEWAGIGMGIRWGSVDEHGDWIECVYDASVYEGVRFWARGNDAEVRLTLNIPEVITTDNYGTCDPDTTSCWNAHGVDLVLVDEWVEYLIPFSDFEQPSWGEQYGELDATKLRTLQFEMAAFSEFDLWIEDLSFYTAGTMPSEPFIPEEPTDSDAGAEVPEPEPDAGMAESETEDEGTVAMDGGQ